MLNKSALKYLATYIIIFNSSCAEQIVERVILAWKRTGHLVSQDLIRNHKDKQKMKIKMQQQYGPFSRPKGKIGEGGLQQWKNAE